MKTKFPNYRIRFMPDNEGNMNEITTIDMPKIKKQKYLTIEEAILFQKKHTNKSIIVYETDPKEIIEYLKENNAILV